jgi:hypothetical protein
VSNTPWTWQDKNLKLLVHVQPGSKSTQLAGLHGDRLKIRLKAPPVDGKANRLLVAFVSELFKVPKSSVSIDKGETSRQKTLIIEDPQFLPADFLTLQTKKTMVPTQYSQ